MIRIKHRLDLLEIYALSVSKTGSLSSDFISAGRHYQHYTTDNYVSMYSLWPVLSAADVSANRHKMTPGRPITAMPAESASMTAPGPATACRRALLLSALSASRSQGSWWSTCRQRRDRRHASPATAGWRATTSSRRTCITLGCLNTCRQPRAHPDAGKRKTASRRANWPSPSRTRRRNAHQEWYRWPGLPPNGARRRSGAVHAVHAEGVTLRNRIAVPPMCQYSADDGFDQRLAPGPLRRPRARRRGAGDRRSHRRVAGRPHHPGLHRHLE